MTAVTNVSSSPAPLSQAGTSSLAATSSGVAGTGTAATSSSPLNQLDNTQTFLKLLVAQLENQNPDSPTNPTSFMTEISQLAAVESQTSLSSEEQVVAADSMLGMQVAGQGASGTLEGVVSGVLLSSSGTPELTFDGSSTELALSAVTEVSRPGGSGSNDAAPGTTTANAGAGATPAASGS